MIRNIKNEYEFVLFSKNTSIEWLLFELNLRGKMKYLDK